MDKLGRISVIIMIVILTLGVAHLPAVEGVATQSGSMAHDMTQGKSGRVSMDFENAALKDVLKAFSRQTGISLIATEAIESKKITVYLNDVSIEEALASILEANGLLYEKQQGDVYLIKPTGRGTVKTITKVFKLNYLQVYKLTPSSQTTGSSSNMTIIGQPAIAEAGSLTSTAANEPAAAESSSGDSQPRGILDVIKSLMSKYGKIVADRRNNSLVISDIPDVFPNIESAIGQLDMEPDQIMIQAEIIETTLSALKEIGMEYGSDDYLAKATYMGADADTPPTFPTPLPFTQSFLKNNYGANLFTSNLFQYGTIQLAEMDMVLKLLENDEDTTILARPRIMTINNEPAFISVSANTAIGTTSSSVTQTQQIISTAERATTGITLKVTPQVNAKGDIFMLIEPSVSRAKASAFFPTTFMDPSYRSSSSTVLIKDGDTVVVAGLIENNESDLTRKVPFLGDIPFVGKLFRSTDTTRSEVELLIFITPRIVKKHNAEYVTPQSLSNREYMIQETMRRYQAIVEKKKSKTSRSKAPRGARENRKDEAAAMDKALTNYTTKTRQAVKRGVQ